MRKTGGLVAGASIAGVGALTGGALWARTHMTEQHKTRIVRTTRIWRLSARRGLHWAVVKVRGSAADDAKRAQLEEQYVIRSAEDVAAVLGNMKGAIMKAGQMFSFIADGLPEQARAALATLQSDVAPMAPSLAEGVIEEEFGRLPHELFLDWEPEPVAAASIGQVHRAVLKDGRKVAVKVQYPGVDKAIASDLDNAQLLYGLFSQFALPSLDVKSLVDEVRERMAEEVDYRIEAASQMEFASHYEGHPFIRIPTVVPEFSGRRVLTSEWVEGMRWQDFLDTATDEAKQKAGEVIARFAHGSVYYHRMFNGDPHPGNYRFHADGSITFLDFGLVKRWTVEELRELMPVLDAVLAQDADGLVARMVELDTLPKDHGLDPKVVLEYASTPYIPFIEDEFTYTRPWMKSALEKVLDMDHNFRDLLDQLDLPASYVILDRLVWGAGSLLSHLQAHNKWGAMLDEYRRGTPPVTELGRQEAQWRSSRGESAHVDWTGVARPHVMD